MAAGQGLDIPDLAKKILTAVETHFAAAHGVALPKRRYIAPGDGRLVAHDTDQLVVSLSGIGLGPAPTAPGLAEQIGSPLSASGIRHAIFIVQLVRCLKEPQDPTKPLPANVVTTMGLSLMRDAGLLSQALMETCTSLSATFGHLRGSAQPGAVAILGPEGGMAAVEGTLAITAAELV